MTHIGSNGSAKNKYILLKLERDELVEKKRKFDRIRVYWISQFSGWLIYAFINIVIIISFDEFNWKKILLSLFLAFLGIGLTHLYRKVIKKRNWLNLSLKKIVPRVLIACIIMGTLMFGILSGLNITLGIYDLSKFKLVSHLVGIFNLSSVNLLWSLIYFSIHFFETYKRVEIESLIWENAVKEFELRTLRSQLNPHFMFNALNSIRALIREDPVNAQVAVTKLSNLLRYSLKIEKSEMVPLEEEIATVCDYLALESIRFEERLRFNVNIDPGAKKIDIPPMMIQTLVENGIKHGISKRTSGGEITINAVLDAAEIKSKKTSGNGRDASELHIQIINSGHIDEEALKNSTGFGIQNTKHRLNLLYGEKAFFSIKNSDEDNVIAELKIPAGG